MIRSQRTGVEIKYKSRWQCSRDFEQTGRSSIGPRSALKMMKPCSIAWQDDTVSDLSFNVLLKRFSWLHNVGKQFLNSNRTMLHFFGRVTVQECDQLTFTRWTLPDTQSRPCTRRRITVELIPHNYRNHLASIALHSYYPHSLHFDTDQST